MHHSPSPTSESVSGSICTSSARHSNKFSSFCDTPPLPESNGSSDVTNNTELRPDTSPILEKKRTRPKLILKTYQSAPRRPVRFSLPVLAPLSMPGIEMEMHCSPSRKASVRSIHSGYTYSSMSRKASMKSLNAGRTSLNLPTGTGIETIQIASPNPPVQSNSVHELPAFTRRLTTPAPLSRSKSVRSAKPPSSHSRYTIAQTFPQQGPRVASFQSIVSTTSAPAVLLTTPTSTPSSLAEPPSQYNPLEHYVPCGVKTCKKHHTPSLLGPTFYSKQQPYGFVRKKGLCVYHANQDLKLAELNGKGVWESMRQNAGRKTLGQIAAEFEIWKQEAREERAIASEELERKLRLTVLGNPASNKSKEQKRLSRRGKTPTGDEKEEGREWDWRYSLRPCTRKTCGGRWYSPYDNRLYFFYHVPRPSGLLPLMTLCPGCAKEDVEDAEDRMEGRRLDAGESAEWKQWCEQFKKDRVMEREFWEGAQEKSVREKFVGVVGNGERMKGKGREEKSADTRKTSQNVKVEQRERQINEVGIELGGGDGKRSKRERIRDVCVVM